jgi:hypothetical protein
MSNRGRAHILKSLVAGEPVQDPQSIPLACAYCRTPFPDPGPYVKGTTPPPCVCGAPMRSALFGADERGVPYHPSQWAR